MNKCMNFKVVFKYMYKKCVHVKWNDYVCKLNIFLLNI